MRGSTQYNNGIGLALAAGVDISGTSKFVGSMTDDDQTRMLEVVQGFNSDTDKGIQKLLADAKAAGKTPDETRKELESFTAQQADRVERFAKNEAWRISEIGGLRAMTQLDGELPSAGMYKTWTVQASACPICLDYAGISVKVKQQFFGGIDGPPAHVTCRCMLTYSVVKEDATGKLEMHCASCDRFLGITDRTETNDQIKCPNSKCRALAVPVLRVLVQPLHNSK